MGINIVFVFKIIDNDIWGIDIFFGFDLVVSIVMDVIDWFYFMVSLYKRVMVIEVMGYKVGWIVLYLGMVGGGDVILVLEIFYNIKNIGDMILNCLKKGKFYLIVVVVEGIQIDGCKCVVEYIVQEIEYEMGIEICEIVLGYIQCGGLFIFFDCNLFICMGGYVIELIVNGQFGCMIVLKGDEIFFVVLEEVVGKLKLVIEEYDFVVQGCWMGICFG